MRIAVLCATRRGYRFLEKLSALQPHCELAVFSFREDPWEPPFLDDIRRLTEAKGGAFFETRNVAEQPGPAFWDRAPVDLMLVSSWRYLIPASVYRKPRLGAFVFHDSLLPGYRGFAPTVWAIINGEDHAGVTLFEMADEMDSGDVVAQKRIAIGPDDTIAEVVERVTQAYLELLERNLPGLLDGTAPRVAQDQSGATYTCKRLPGDNRIDWAGATRDIYNLIRAVGAPYPGAFSTFSGATLRVWAARRLTGWRRYVGGTPGRVVEVRPGEGTVVLTGDGALLLTRVEIEGRGIVCAADVLNRLDHTLGN